ncbi:MAG: hypothetical protein ACPLHI_06035 [Pseudothermotoga sp.]|jgi:hypothetical protein
MLLPKNIRGTVECKIDQSAEGYLIKCKANLDGVEDSYTLRLQLAGGLTFPYGIDASDNVVLGNNLTIVGDVLVRKENLSIGNNGIIKGSVYLMGGDLILGQGTVIERDVLTVGSVDPSTNGAKATVQGNVILAGSIDKNITVNGTVTKTSVEVVRAEISKRVNTAEPPLPATPSFFPNSAVKVQGNVISEGGKTYYTGNSVENGLSVSNTTLTFQIPSTGLLSLAVTKLDLGNSTTINIQGTGVVMIYVRDTVYANQLTINMNKDTRLLITRTLGRSTTGKKIFTSRTVLLYRKADCTYTHPRKT